MLSLVLQSTYTAQVLVLRYAMFVFRTVGMTDEDEAKGNFVVSTRYVVIGGRRGHM